MKPLTARVLLWTLVVVPLGFLLPPIVLFPYRRNVPHLLIAAGLVIVAGLVFFLQSVGIGVILYWLAGLYVIGRQSLWLFGVEKGRAPGRAPLPTG
jgi:hypothetical protein